MPGKQLFRLFLSGAFAVLATAAPSLTTVQDILYKADGSRFNGTVRIEWQTFQAFDGSEIAQGIKDIRVISGYLQVAVTPTTSALTPAYYTVTYNSEGRTQFSEFWSVPPSTAPLRLRDVRTHGPVAGSVTSPSTSIAIQDISGLRTELDLRPARGATWVPGRTAVIGSSGSIESAIGQPGDCVHVDGTSGPCGSGGLMYVDGENPDGAIDGLNRQFTLSAPPYPQASLHLYRNGVLLRQGLGYTLSGNTISFTPESAPVPGDVLAASYRVDTAATTVTVVVDLETPAGVVDGNNTEFTLLSAPLPAASLQLFRNGLLQKAGVDYVISVDKVSFLPVSVPMPGDILQATYRR